jgi:hypothetical protein
MSLRELAGKDISYVYFLMLTFQPTIAAFLNDFYHLMGIDNVLTMPTDAVLAHVASNSIGFTTQQKYSDDCSILFGSFWTVQRRLLRMLHAQ